MIRQLSPHVQSQIRSGVAITSVTQCVEELLLNAVDANSKCIAVRIDLSHFRIQVVDNGTGISADQLDKVGQRYSTSKCRTLEDLESLTQYGYRGEALASICDVSYILELTSRAYCSAHTFCKIFQQGKSLDASESKIHRPSPGTTVTVHNIFYNLPVHQKAISATLEMENICHRVEALALMQPSVSITLRNDVTGSILIQTHKTNSPLVTFSYLFNHAKTQSLVSVSTSVGHFCIKGYLGKEGHYRKDLQFVYVNKRLVLKTPLHKLVNRVLRKSLIFRQRQTLDSSEKVSPSKQADKYPIFFLNIECPLNAYDITFEPRKTMIEFTDWDSLNSGVEDMCKEFLVKENLLSIDCLLPEEKDSLNPSQIDSNKGSSKLQTNDYESTTLDKIHDEMFTNIMTRGLKSCPIKRLFEKIPSSEIAASEEPTANKQCKTEESLAEERVVSSDQTNFTSTSQSCVLSSSSESFLDDQPDVERFPPGDGENDNHQRKLYLPPDSHLVPRISFESEKMPFEETNADINPLRTESYFSDCDLLHNEIHLTRKDFRSNYINEKLNYEKLKQSIVVDSNKIQNLCPNLNSSFIKSSSLNVNSKIPMSEFPMTLQLESSKKLPGEQKVCNKSKDTWSPPVKMISSIAKGLEKYSEELSPAKKLSLTTKSVLDRFRAPQRHRRETAVEKIDFHINRLICPKKMGFNLDTKNSFQKRKVSENNDSKEQLELNKHLPDSETNPNWDYLSIKEHGVLQKLLNEKSSGNSISSKLSKLYRKNGINSCSPSKIIATAKPNEKFKTADENQKIKNQNSDFQIKQKDGLQNLQTEMSLRKTSYKKVFMPEFNERIAKPVQEFILPWNSEPKNITCKALANKQDFLESRVLGEKKRQFFHSSDFLQTFHNLKNPTAKMERIQQKESQERNSKNFNIKFVESLVRNQINEQDYFANDGNLKRNSQSEMRQSLCFTSFSKDKSDKDSNDVRLKKSNIHLENKVSIKQDSDYMKNVSSKESSTELLQLSQPFNANIPLDKPILSLDFSSDKTLVSTSEKQDSSLIHFDNSFLNDNLNKEGWVSESKTPDDQSLAITFSESDSEIQLSSLIEAQKNLEKLEENNCKEKDQIIGCENSTLYFDKPVIGETEDKSAFVSQAPICPVSLGITDGTIGKEFLGHSFTQLNTTSSKEEEKCLYSNPKSNETVSTTCKYLDVVPEILNSTSETLSNGNNEPNIFITSVELSNKTSEASRNCFQMSSKTNKKLGENLHDICQTSNKSFEMNNPTFGRLKEISQTSHETYEILINPIEVSKNLLENITHPPFASSNTFDEPINISQAVKKDLNIEFQNSHISKCDSSPPLNLFKFDHNHSSFNNQESLIKSGLIIDENLSPIASRSLLTESIPCSVLEISKPKKNDDKSFITEEEDSSIKEATHFAYTHVGQSQNQCMLNEPSLASDDLKCTDRVDQWKRSESDKSVQASLKAETLTSPKDLFANIQNAKENSGSFDNSTETHIQPEFPSLSKETECTQRIKKLSETGILNQIIFSGGIYQNSFESPRVSKREEISHNSTSSGTCLADLSKNVDHLENPQAVILQDMVPAKGSPFPSGSLATLDLDLNKEEQKDPKQCGSNSQPNKSPETEFFQDSSSKTDESHSQKPKIESCFIEEKTDEAKISEKNETDLTLDLWKNWKNPVFKMGEVDILDIWTNCSVQQKLHRVIHSCQFTKAMISQMETIGQVDKKFIACIVKSQDGKSEIPDHLLIIDQHAAHERVRLEQLTADIYESDSYENENMVIKCSQVFPPWTLSLLDKEMRIVTSFLDEFTKIGLQLKLCPEKNKIEIYSAPSCIMTREVSERKHNRNSIAMELVEALIKEKIELLHTCGTHSTLPKTIHNLLCSQACRGAIKFNDSLTLEECQNLLKMLLKCKLPFQCAHGRPSVIPLVNLHHLKRNFQNLERSKINLKKLKNLITEPVKMTS